MTRALRVALLGGGSLLLATAAYVSGGGCTPVQAAHHAMTVLTCMPAHGMGPMGYAWPMFVGHLVATVGTAWLLARGEDWCSRLVARAVHASYVAPAARPGRRRPRPSTTAVVRALVCQPRRPRPARGPPLAFA